MHTRNDIVMLEMASHLTSFGIVKFNSIYLLIRQTCWHTTMLHKMKSYNHVQHVFILFCQTSRGGVKKNCENFI